MPKALKRRAYDIMVDAKLPLGDYYPGNNEEGQGEVGFKDIMANLQSDNFYDRKEVKKYLREFINFTRNLDTLRKTDIMKVIPELAYLFDKNAMKLYEVAY